MEDSFKVTYNVDDGYVGGDRPQHLKISAEYLWDDSTDETLMELFWESIQEHFTRNCHPYTAQEGEFLLWAKEQLKARQE